MTEPRRTDNKPHDRLTRLCDAMTKAMEAHPEFIEGDKAVIMLDDGHMGGIVLSGYDKDDWPSAVADVLIHLRAVLRAYGKDLEVIAIPDSPGDLR